MPDDTPKPLDSIAGDSNGDQVQNTPPQKPDIAPTGAQPTDNTPAPSGAQPAPPPPPPSSEGKSMPPPAPAAPQPQSPSSAPKAPPPPPASSTAATPPPPPPGAQGASAKGTGKGQDGSLSSPPEAPDVQIRTMESDTDSLKETGGEMARPEVVNMESGETKDGKEVLRVPAYAGDEEAVFKSGSTDKEKTKNKTGGAKKKKLIALIALIVIVLGGLAALAYFYIYPMLYGPVDTAPTPTPTLTATPTPAPTATPTPAPARTYQSLFAAPLTNSFEIALQNPTPSSESIIAAISSRYADIQEETLTEIVLLDQNSEPLTFDAAMAAFYPSLAMDAGVFEENVTFFVYKDSSALWPGFIAKAEDAEAARNALQELESLSNEELTSLYLITTGNADVAGFKDGTINSVSTRYTTFEQPGAAFNYGVASDGTSLISTSYLGMKAAINALTPPPTATPEQASPSPTDTN